MKTWKKIILSLLPLVIIACIWFYPKYKILNHTIHLFDEDSIVTNFRTLDSVYPFSTMNASSNPFIYPKGVNFAMPESFVFKGERFKANQFIKDSWTTGLLVIQNDSIVFEKYYLGNTETTKNISWSMAKSFISALIGIAIADGFIDNINQNVEDYVPELVGTAYEGVRIKDVLQMSTGVAFNEDYGDFFSDINRWGRSFALGSSQDDFAATLKRETKPGTVNHYVSINTHVLGMILDRATGRSITSYMQEKLIEPLGIEYDSYWIKDGENMEVALGGLNMTLRDYAKIGSLYMHNGLWRNNQIISEDWVKVSVVSEGQHVQPGESFGYGYQWWIPEGEKGEFMAIGVYNQYIYINPITHTIVVKLSANPRYNDVEFEPSSDYASLEFFRSIAEHFENIEIREELNLNEQ
jgi:CubicO group peptidase (beta-lactamase class C family)